VDACELSPGQEALWFLQQLAPDSSAYNCSGAMNLHFPVDIGIMAQAVRRVVRGQRLLTSVFRSAGGQVRRQPTDAGHSLEVHEPAGNDSAVRAFALGLTQQPFRLDREPPIRVALLRRDSSPDILLITAHHIVVDNVSSLLIVQEILAEYAAISAGRERAVRDTTADFDEFVRKQRNYLGSPQADAAREYWRAELAEFPDQDLPTDLARPVRYQFTGAEIDFELTQADMAAVTDAAAERKTTSFAYLFALFQRLLSDYSGQHDFVIGYPVTMRPGKRFRESIGYFVNTLPFRARVDPGVSFDVLLQRTGKSLWRGLMHREYPLAMMPGLVDIPRRPDRAGLIPVMLAVSGSDTDDPFTSALERGLPAAHAGLTVSEFYLPQQLGQFDLTIQVQRHAAGARARLKYNTSLFTAETAQSLADRYVALLRSITAARWRR
jgi:hypothetical protein